uniref:Uncharacterized protein n=1 Tax=Musa acuminata subsp. malaccensis TaxID=214687 RepID=A0A804II97_MUSAM
MLQLLFALGFSVVPLTLYVPPIRSLNRFLAAMEAFAEEAAAYSQRAYPMLRLGLRRIFAVASRSFR